MRRAGLLLAALAGLSSATAPAQPTAGVSLGEIFAGFLAGHLDRFREEAPEATYQTGEADLNGDGIGERLVYLNDPIWCGPHGCDLLIFTRDRRSGWRQMAEISVGAPPILMLSHRTRGWHDLSLYISDSLAPGEQQALAFNGTTYAGPTRPLSYQGQGRPLILRDSPSEPLFRRRQTRSR
jgi:hypothetical protein